MNVLEVRDLATHFFTRDGVVRAVDGVSFDLAAGETLGIVGESGCGKSVTALSILRLIGAETGRIVAGSVRFEGRELTALSDEEMRDIRGHKISMIFQEPMTSLNPVLTIGTQIAENVVRHWKVPWKAALDRAQEMLDLVGISDSRRRLDEYPHQLSGGMRQRVMIAIALACDPQVLIADEPTTALDVTIQAQILDLMLDLKERFGTAIIMITHDLGVVAETTQRVVVMYAGRKVEEASVEQLFARPDAPLHARADARHPAARRRCGSGGAAAAPARDRRHRPGADTPDPGLRLRAALPLCGRALPRRAADARGTGVRPHGRLLGGAARAGSGRMSESLRLEVKNLVKHFPAGGGFIGGRSGRCAPSTA